MRFIFLMSILTYLTYGAHHEPTLLDASQLAGLFPGINPNPPPPPPSRPVPSGPPQGQVQFQQQQQQQQSFQSTFKPFQPNSNNNFFSGQQTNSHLPAFQSSNSFQFQGFSSSFVPLNDDNDFVIEELIEWNKPAQPSRQISEPGQRNCVRFDGKQMQKFGDDTLYYLSWRDPVNQGRRQLKWNEAREVCLNHCMDLVSIESSQENGFLLNEIRKGDIYGAYTGGRFCNPGNCSFNSHDMMQNWAWVPTGQKVGPFWSKKGGLSLPQPDNLRGRLAGKDEECLAVLNDWYNDGIAWHDVVCTDLLPFICEASIQKQAPNQGFSGEKGNVRLTNQTPSNFEGPQQYRGPAATENQKSPPPQKTRGPLPVHQRPPLPHQRPYRVRNPSMRRRNPLKK